MTARLERLRRGTAPPPGRTILAWLFIAIALGIAGVAAGGEFNDNFKVPGVQSQTAIDRLQEDFPTAAGSANNQIVFHATTGTLSDPQDQAAIAEAVENVK